MVSDLEKGWGNQDLTPFLKQNRAILSSNLNFLGLEKRNVYSRYRNLYRCNSKRKPILSCLGFAFVLSSAPKSRKFVRGAGEGKIFSEKPRTGDDLLSCVRFLHHDIRWIDFWIPDGRFDC